MPPQSQNAAEYILRTGKNNTLFRKNKIPGVNTNGCLERKGIFKIPSRHYLSTLSEFYNWQ